MQQTMLELSNPFDAYARKLGYCLVIVMTAGSVHSNPQFLVRIYETGELRTVDQNDLRVYGNPSTGEKLNPFIPYDWLNVKDKMNENERKQ